MTPAARLAAAIELFAAVSAARAAADQVTGDWFRARRYAGAKDRRAIADLVYAALRRRAEIGWRLERAGAEPTPRLLVMGAAGLPADELERLCDGSRFAPAALAVAELAALRALAEPPPADLPDWVRGKYPEWLDDSLKSRFGAELVAEMAALDARAPLDLRVNALKGERAAALEALRADGFAAEPTPFSPLGIRLPTGTRLETHPLVRAGWLEPQDEAAQIASLLVDARPGMQVVDYCAGAGGKTLALAAAMHNRGQIYAFDRDAARLARLKPRLQRAGVRNVQTHRLGGGDGPLAGLAASADRVLVDAPCSGTGTWRRNPEARWKLTPEILARQCELQRQLLAEAAPLVRPGGRLVYATCSILVEEDEAPVELFLASHPDFALVPVTDVWAAAVGGACPVPGPYLLLTPRRHGTDGFFAAVLERR
jgi:16S rRNA (cytosine967-C5)-methyltransferase